MLDERFFFWALVGLGVLLVLFAFWLRATTRSAPLVNMRIGSQSGALQIEGVVINAVHDDPDPGEPARDPLDVATRIAQERLAETEPSRDETCVEALALLALRKALPVELAEQPAARLVGALQGELAEAEPIVRELGVTRWRCVEAFAASRWPLETAKWAEDLAAPIGEVLIDALARVDPDRADALAKDDVRAIAVALLAAIDAGVDSAALAKRFAEARDRLSGNDLEVWQRFELLRLSHTDLDGACALWDEHSSRLHEPAQLFAEQLARADADRARAVLGKARQSAAPFDWLPLARGCALAGLDVSAELDDARAQLTSAAYRPAGMFQLLVDLDVRREDPDAIRSCLAQAGPHAWQTARCTIDAMRALARRGSQKRAECLDACLTPVTPGVVAARDASVGLVAGHAMTRPAWLVFRTVHPLELLVLSCALESDAPRWTARCLDG